MNSHVVLSKQTKKTRKAKTRKRTMGDEHHFYYIFPNVCVYAGRCVCVPYVIKEHDLSLKRHSFCIWDTYRNFKQKPI